MARNFGPRRKSPDRQRGLGEFLLRRVPGEGGGAREFAARESTAQYKPSRGSRAPSDRTSTLARGRSRRSTRRDRDANGRRRGSRACGRSTSFITARCSFGSIRNAVRASRGNAAGSLACIAFWMLAIGRTSSTAFSLSPMMKPQHSNGNSRSACATIASMLARCIDAVFIDSPSSASRVPRLAPAASASDSFPRRGRGGRPVRQSFR